MSCDCKRPVSLPHVVMGCLQCVIVVFLSYTVLLFKLISKTKMMLSFVLLCCFQIISIAVKKTDINRTPNYLTILCTISLALSNVSHPFWAHLCAISNNFNCNDENRISGK